MKNISIIFLLLCIGYGATAQDWHWQNPKPQGNSLGSVFFIDDNTG